MVGNASRLVGWLDIEPWRVRECRLQTEECRTTIASESRESLSYEIKAEEVSKRKLACHLQIESKKKSGRCWTRTSDLNDVNVAL